MDANKAWLGALYLKDEGGYDIVLKALEHYKRRLKTIGKSPELQGAAAMFSVVLRQQAVKIIPEIDVVCDKICNSLACNDYTLVSKIVDDMPLVKKALLCYKSDIQKARDTKHEYFIKLIHHHNDKKSSTEDSQSSETTSDTLDMIESAILKLDASET